MEIVIYRNSIGKLMSFNFGCIGFLFGPSLRSKIANTKVWWIRHIIIVMFINGVRYVTLLEAVGYCWFWWCFNTKLGSVAHIIIVMFSMEHAMEDFWKYCKFRCSGHTFRPYFRGYFSSQFPLPSSRIKIGLWYPRCYIHLWCRYWLQ